MPININEIPVKDIKSDDVVQIQNLQYYLSSTDEVTDLVEMFAGKLMSVVAVSEDVNEWGEHTYTCKNANGSCTFTDHELYKAYRIEVT